MITDIGNNVGVADHTKCVSKRKKWQFSLKLLNLFAKEFRKFWENLFCFRKK